MMSVEAQVSRLRWQVRGLAVLLAVAVGTAVFMGMADRSVGVSDARFDKVVCDVLECRMIGLFEDGDLKGYVIADDDSCSLCLKKQNGTSVYYPPEG